MIGLRMIFKMMAQMTLGERQWTTFPFWLQSTPQLTTTKSKWEDVIHLSPEVLFVKLVARMAWTASADYLLLSMQCSIRLSFPPQTFIPVLLWGRSSRFTPIISTKNLECWRRQLVGFRHTTKFIWGPTTAGDSYCRPNRWKSGWHERW